MTTIKRSIDGKVKFYEKSHIYKIKNKKLLSVTSLFKKFFPEFDQRKIAKELCSWHPKYKKLGIRKTLAKWKESAEHGTRTHFLLENFLLGEFNNGVNYVVTLSDYKEKDINKYTHARKWLEHYFRCVGEPNVIPELIVYDEELGLAGQIDVLVERNGLNKDGTENNDRVIDLLDFKTNEKITMDGYKGAKAFEPIDDMPDCSYTKYTLQLSMYAYMLERQGHIIGDLTLLHLQEDKVVPMKIEYRKDLIEKVLAHGKENNI